jgi:hypothetical protein
MKRLTDLGKATRRGFLVLAARLAALGLVLPWLPAEAGKRRLSLREAQFYHKGH